MKRISSQVKMELKELKYLENWYYVMSGFTRSRWHHNPFNVERIKRLKFLRNKYLMNVIGLGNTEEGGM